MFILATLHKSLKIKPCVFGWPSFQKPCSNSYTVTNSCNLVFSWDASNFPGGAKTIGKIREQLAGVPEVVKQVVLCSQDTGRLNSWLWAHQKHGGGRHIAEQLQNKLLWSRCLHLPQLWSEMTSFRMISRTFVRQCGRVDITLLGRLEQTLSKILTAQSRGSWNTTASNELLCWILCL